MPAYHSIFLDEDNVQTIGNFPILPLRTRTRGPAYTLPLLPPGSSDIDIDPDSDSYDCLDEVLSLYRANTFFRNFEIKGPADRMLIYGILFLSECLGKVKPNMASREAEKALINASLDHFAIPGDAAFPLNQAFEPPRDRQDAEALRQYISQVRQELAIRLHNRLYPGGEGPSKLIDMRPEVVAKFFETEVHGQVPIDLKQGCSLNTLGQAFGALSPLAPIRGKRW